MDARAALVLINGTKHSKGFGSHLSRRGPSSTSHSPPKMGMGGRGGVSSAEQLESTPHETVVASAIAVEYSPELRTSYGDLNGSEDSSGSAAAARNPRASCKRDASEVAITAGGVPTCGAGAGSTRLNRTLSLGDDEESAMISASDQPQQPQRARRTEKEADRSISSFKDLERSATYSSTRPSTTLRPALCPRYLVDRRLHRELWLGDRGVVQQTPPAGPYPKVSTEDQFAGLREALAEVATTNAKVAAKAADGDSTSAEVAATTAGDGE